MRTWLLLSALLLSTSLSIRFFSWKTFTTLIRYLFLLFNQFVTGKSDSEKKEMLKKIESQLLSSGKDKLTVDEYYNVLKVQV